MDGARTACALWSCLPGPGGAAACAAASALGFVEPPGSGRSGTLRAVSERLVFEGGPQASDALVEIFTTSGYVVHAAASAWQLGSADAPLVHALAKGVADAVGQTGRVDAREIAAWLQARLTGALCTVGHTDVLALPSR